MRFAIGGRKIEKEREKERERGGGGEGMVNKINRWIDRSVMRF